MEVLAAIIGAGFLVVVLWDAFETIILPRRVTRRIRLARLFYRYTWMPYSALTGVSAGGINKMGYSP